MNDNEEWVIFCLSKHQVSCESCIHWVGDMQDCGDFILVFCDHDNCGKTIMKEYINSPCIYFDLDTIEGEIVGNESNEMVN